MKLIQKIYRENKYKKKERIYFGYDKEKLNILKIYIDSLDNNGNIIKIDVNNYSIKECKNKYVKINIKDLLNVDFITKDKINDLIDDIILMINNEKPKEKMGKDNSYFKLKNSPNKNNKFGIYSNDKNKKMNLLKFNISNTSSNVSTRPYKRNNSKNRIINNYLSKKVNMEGN